MHVEFGESDICVSRYMSECPFKDYYLCLENCESLCYDEEPVIESDPYSEEVIDE